MDARSAALCFLLCLLLCPLRSLVVFNVARVVLVAAVVVVGVVVVQS